MRFLVVRGKVRSLDSINGFDDWLTLWTDVNGRSYNDGELRIVEIIESDDQGRPIRAMAKLVT